MKEIIVIIQPFVYNQQVYLFENGKLTKHKNVPMMDLSATLVAFAHHEGVTDITLKGDVHFTNKMMEETKEKEPVMYKTNNLKINIV